MPTDAHPLPPTPTARVPRSHRSYLPLLGASGAFPCTILYVLLPLLALRRLRANRIGEQSPWLPGGASGLLALATMPVAMLLASTATIVTALLGAFQMWMLRVPALLSVNAATRHALPRMGAALSVVRVRVALALSALVATGAGWRRASRVRDVAEDRGAYDED